ncbi:MAG: hypothetical protein B7W99_00875 [Rhodospirillales bacterium 20-58-10]|nr:MAG: hypothetical protein B7W99_00875 [Rhodospirillales bacterium 20-58-10]
MGKPTGHYHCEAKAVSRATGRSVVAAAAYRAAAKVTDERTGITHDYTRKRGVLHSEIVAPPGSPTWTFDRAAVWNAAEAAENKSTRRDAAKTGRDFIIGLPHEISAEGRLMATRQFAQYLAESYGVVVDFSIHEPDEDGDQRNFHAHVLTSTRVMTDAGFGGKVRELDSPRTSGKHLEAIRAKWAEIQNSAYAREGIDVRVDHRSYVAQGIDKDATVHLGPAASGMERRGEETDLGDRNRKAKANNEKREQIKAEIEVVGLEIRDEATARAERQAKREERAAARTFDPAKILDVITERRSTFSRSDVSQLLWDSVANNAERSEVVTAILARDDVIGLRETASGSVTRYTTRAVLAAEMRVMQAARLLDRTSRYGLTDWQKAEALDRHSHLDGEQRAAFDHATGAAALSLLAGEAGTGKSTTMSAIRDSYEDAGYRVIGLAWTNAVVQDMRADGFGEASTIASELMRVERGSSGWNSRTVLMVDEAAMLSTKHLASLMDRAEAAGAKVILTGDDQQLASIERGGVFGALRQEYGAAELHTVRRVSDAEQRRAFNLMHEGKFRPALDIFDRQGAIHWTQTDDEARSALVAKYAVDMAAAPGKSRFVFANSNAEVAALNRDIRALYRERGQLGADHVLRGADGAESYAKGDRIMFTGSARTKAARDIGFINGATGTIQEIEGKRVTMALDAKGRGPARLVAFTVGEDAEAGEFNSFRHGYAGTIYKGQGRTLDQTYVLHSASMGAASSYVGMSRHRESVSLFTTRGADAWMMAIGGVDGLTEAQRNSAERSYARWGEAKPELAARYGFGDYVAYVQEQQAQRPADHKADLDRLARQMGRVDDRRSASQFHREDAQGATGGRDTVSFDRVARRATGGARDGRGDPVEASTPADVRTGPTTRQKAAAHGIGARVSATRNPFRQAQVLHRAHIRDANARRMAELVAKRDQEQRQAEQAARAADTRKQTQLERDQLARDLTTRRAAEPGKAPADPKPAAAEATRPAAEKADRATSVDPFEAFKRMADDAKKAADIETQRERERGRYRDRGRTR